LLEVRDLSIHYITEGKPPARAVENVSFTLHEGELMGLVGESGCGKTTLMLGLLRLLPAAGQIVGGKVHFMGRDVTAMSEQELLDVRWDGISIIFQGAMNALNPVRTIGDQIREAIIKHVAILPGDKVDDRVVELLDLVGITADHKEHFPYQYSGGMRQRAMIAMALSCNPKILLADEPTTALDVTIQAQILDLMFNLKEELGMAIILITHNLGVVAESARRVVVMYCGKVVEEGPVLEIFKQPQHPYTQGLLQSLPRLEEKATGQKQRLMEIPGIVPSPYNLPTGCMFHPRCPKAQAICQEQEPPLEKVPGGHYSACFFPG
ncbi:MAG: ABC transporter ATP-binding protein, partial [Planctomycetaceae bacterium]